MSIVQSKSEYQSVTEMTYVAICVRLPLSISSPSMGPVGCRCPRWEHSRSLELSFEVFSKSPLNHCSDVRRYDSCIGSVRRANATFYVAAGTADSPPNLAKLCDSEQYLEW